MSLTLAQVEHIAELARLTLTDQEKARFGEQLSDILDYAARLQALDTTGIAPTASVLPERSVLRADESRPGLSVQALLSNAPMTEADQFRVPPVLDLD
jgi:aspartyl-tRNA(Asn)/glutamyl-tRNA(Gln) amidotransferase subunit C